MKEVGILSEEIIYCIHLFEVDVGCTSGDVWSALDNYISPNLLAVSWPSKLLILPFSKWNVAFLNCDFEFPSGRQWCVCVNNEQRWELYILWVRACNSIADELFHQWHSQLSFYQASVLLLLMQSLTFSSACGRFAFGWETVFLCLRVHLCIDLWWHPCASILQNVLVFHKRCIFRLFRCRSGLFLHIVEHCKHCTSWQTRYYQHRLSTTFSIAHFRRVTHRSFSRYGSICGGRGGDGGGGGVPLVVTQGPFPRMLWKLMSVWVLLSMQSEMASTRAVPPAMPVLLLCPLRTTWRSKGSWGCPSWLWPKWHPLFSLSFGQTKRQRRERKKIHW